MYIKNFDPETGVIILPDTYSKVVSSDAVFEMVQCVEAKKLLLERQDDVIGHRMMIYTIDKADKTREPIRKIAIEFFKQELGFKDGDIIFVDRNEFIGTEGEWATDFSAETKEAMKKFAKHIFEDT